MFNFYTGSVKCFAYADESGNSGLRLFGDTQDTFWTGTVIAFSDLDSKYSTFHRELTALSGRDELHGNELGFGRIEKIAGRMAMFIRQKKLRFSFVRVHKPYLAATKMFDLAFDAGVNPAVPPHTYGVRQLRLINLLHFSQLLTIDDLNEFWSLFEAQSTSRFGRLLADVCDRAKDTPYDKRSVQILTESLDWASKHPEKVLDPFGERDSPNFVAFTALFDNLHSFHKETGHTIGSFVHDEQEQFVPKFVEAFELISKFQGDDSGPLSMAADLSAVATFECNLAIRSSADSFGLQIVDVCLWLAKRVLERNDIPRGQCATLWNCLVERSYIKEYDFAMLVREIKAGANLLEQRSSTAAQIADAKRTLAQIEEARKKRLAQNP